MRHLNLRFGPGETQFAFEDVGIVILVRERQRFLSRVRNRSAERASHSLIRRNTDATSQAEHRIEHCARRI
jgi:hypothetical protein